MTKKTEDKKLDRKLERSRTFENLKKSFYEEASLVFRYLYFAQIAEFEGQERFKALFNEFAEGGHSNVHGSLDFLREAKDPSSDIPLGGTLKNIESVIQTETQQCSEIYPQMAQVAREEGFTDIASWFETLEKLKRSHLNRMKKVKNG
jgi:rubrerythrin